MPYQCRHCGGTHCAEHRLPENHGCPGLENWGDPGGVFDSGFDASVNGRTEDRSLIERIGLDTGPGSVVGYFRGNVSYLFLAIMLIVFVAEIVVIAIFQDATLFRALFVLSSDNPLYLWTWVTSVFAHAPFTFWHIFGNGIVLFFFGPVLERRIGSRRFAALFLVSGAVAGLAQVGLGMVLGNPTSVLGASGAIMAVLGVITVLNPDLKVYLYFLVPVPIWVLTFGYALLSVIGVFSAFSVLGGNVAHFAHLSGLVIGLAYGQRVKDELRVPGEIQFGRGGRRPGGRF